MITIDRIRAMTDRELLFHNRRTSGDLFIDDEARDFFTHRVQRMLRSLPDEVYESLSQEVGW